MVAVPHASALHGFAGTAADGKRVCVIRLKISDGVHFMQGMLTTSQNDVRLMLLVHTRGAAVCAPAVAVCAQRACTRGRTVLSLCLSTAHLPRQDDRGRAHQAHGVRVQHCVEPAVRARRLLLTSVSRRTFTRAALSGCWRGGRARLPAASA
jgi:hypothetical protein